MKKVGIIYWSGSGNTEIMAKELEKNLSKDVEVKVLTPSELGGGNVADFDSCLLGCPSMGAEVLEEYEFQPMWDEIKSSLASKKVGLFGSYGWGDGEWMRNWETESKEASIDVVGTVICCGAPDGDGEAQLAELAKAVI